MSGDLPTERQDADRAAPPILVDEAYPRSPRSPTVACVPMWTRCRCEPMPTPADLRLDHRHRRADVVPRDGRRPTIPHYDDTADAKTRSMANSAVTQRFVAHSFGKCAFPSRRLEVDGASAR